MASATYAGGALLQRSIDLYFSLRQAPNLLLQQDRRQPSRRFAP
jgi:hypothetical protein